ncbi:GPI mannosyltransferase 2 [Xylariaceae sp. FL0016]|nr:GPI mannosyltransferase 2 [Xylariaceae sp. FL0016]
MLTHNVAHPVRSLVTAFLAWKTFLLIVALGAGVGPAYDTSSTLLYERASSAEWFFDLPTRLTRWDAIYFMQMSRRGYLFEQEWAFGSGLPAVISFFTKTLTNYGIGSDVSLPPLLGVVVANSSHLLSALVLYKLGLVVRLNARVSFIGALLHILSPAGLFLSAPYNESPYALLSFLGYLFFAKAVLSEKRTMAHDISIVVAGVWSGFALTFRSNGILNGVPFAVEFIRELTSPTTFGSIRRRLALVVGGSAIAVGFVLPQLVAYLDFCFDPNDDDARPWCSKRIPSVYSFAQEHYWNVGFLRYWTPGNIPLFLLAAPMLYLLSQSGLDVLTWPSSSIATATQPPQNVVSTAQRYWFRSMASAQLILTALAITTYHIQIITRISSGYPLWYWWLASKLSSKEKARFGGQVVVFMVMYAGIQGALFASFLPPA